jgi:hypothetical protein
MIPTSQKRGDEIALAPVIKKKVSLHSVSFATDIFQ